MRIIEILDGVGANICINTVVHKQNINDIPHILPLLLPFASISKWQLFQFAPIGPLGFRNREIYSIDTNLFGVLRKRLTEAILSSDFAGCIEFKSNEDRKGNYLLIDSEGLAWVPKGSTTNNWHDENDISDQRLILGDIKNSQNHKIILDTILNPKVTLPILSQIPSLEPALYR